MPSRKLLGVAGSVILFLGVFMPIVSLPMVGNVNFFQNGEGDGTLILLIALLSILFSLREAFKWLWFTGVASVGILLLTLIAFHSRIGLVKQQMESQLADNPFRGLADIALQSVQLQWGWAVLMVGAVMIVAAAAMKED